jgi:hypothetical protein
MNPEKAREFFSAYLEDNLEAGLKQALEQRLRADANLQADYAAFVETMQQLDTLKHEEIEIPSFLSDRIATRLEQVQSRQKFGLPVWTTWVRNFAFAGLAFVAITFALPLFHSDKTTSQGGIAGISNSVDQLVFKADGSDLVLNFQATGTKTVVVSSPVSGKEVKRFNLDGQNLQSPIENKLENPALFKVEVLGDRISSLIAVPGTGTVKAKTGEGTVQDLAVSLAGRYHVPVVIEAADVTRHVSWSFDSPDAVTAATQAVANEGFSVDQRSGGLIKILDR